MRPLLPTLFLVLAACQTHPEGAKGVPGEGPTLRNELSFAVGEFNEADEKGARFAVDYERRAPGGWGGFVSERWGFGAILDFYVNPVESILAAAQAVYHPVEPVSLIVAGGFSNNDDEGFDSWLLRLGTRYSFDLAENVAFGPEIFYDIFEDGVRRGVLGFSLTYRF